jgi:hypothetical protein
MDVAELEEAEFAYLLATLHVPGLIGVDSPALFPTMPADRDAVLGAGLRQLQAHGWMKPRAQPGQYDLNPELMELAAVVAGPQYVVLTRTLQPGGYQRLFLHYVAGDDIVELSTTLGCYRLLALPSQEALYQRVSDLLGVFGTPEAGQPAPEPFIIDERLFVEFRALAQRGALEQAAATLTAHGVTRSAAAALAAAVGATPEGSGQVAMVRAGDRAAVTAGRKATLYGKQDWVWLVHHLEADSMRVQVQVAQSDTLAAVLRQYFDFLKKA